MLGGGFTGGCSSPAWFVDHAPLCKAAQGAAIALARLLAAQCCLLILVGRFDRRFAPAFDCTCHLKLNRAFCRSGSLSWNRCYGASWGSHKYWARSNEPCWNQSALWYRGGLCKLFYIAVVRIKLQGCSRAFVMTPPHTAALHCRLSQAHLANEVPVQLYVCKLVVDQQGLGFSIVPGQSSRPLVNAGDRLACRLPLPCPADRQQA